MVARNKSLYIFGGGKSNAILSSSDHYIVNTTSLTYSLVSINKEFTKLQNVLWDGTM